MVLTGKCTKYLLASIEPQKIIFFSWNLSVESLKLACI